MQKKNQVRKLRLSRDTIRALRADRMAIVRGGFIPDPTTAATDGDTGRQSEATGCHTGFSGCGTC